MSPAPTCPYCGSQARLVPSQRIYGPNSPSYGDMWACANYPLCNAYVGCHRGTSTPLGRLADKELRNAKMAAHAAFDRLWQTKARRDGISRGKARGLAYRWLAEQMGIEPTACHIGMFDPVQCRRVVELCKPYHRGRK